MSINACVAERQSGTEVVYYCNAANARRCHWAHPMPGAPRHCAWCKAGRCGQMTARRAALIAIAEPEDHSGEADEMIG